MWTERPGAPMRTCELLMIPLALLLLHALCAFAQQARPTVIYDENLVPKYTLPDPLVTEGGEKVRIDPVFTGAHGEHEDGAVAIQIDHGAAPGSAGQRAIDHDVVVEYVARLERLSREQQREPLPIVFPHLLIGNLADRSPERYRLVCLRWLALEVGSGKDMKLLAGFWASSCRT